MRTYTLTTRTDLHGQPLRLFRANAENNASKAIDQLSGICAGILADGVVNDAEVAFFSEWVRRFAPLELGWPFSDIVSRVERIFADGRCDESERRELQSVMEALCGYTSESEPAENYSTSLPLDEPLPTPVIFPDQKFVITGRFAYGTRRKVFAAIESLGGIPTDASPSLDTHYLIIGIFASKDWINTNFGRKIQAAVRLRSSGSGITIIPEQHWQRFINAS